MENQTNADDENQPLGWAVRETVQQSIYSQTAHKFLQALIEHSPSPETVARQVLTRLGECQNLAVANLGDAVSTYVIILLLINFMRKSTICSMRAGTAIASSVRMSGRQP
jgi:hypothetical protein